MTSEDVIDAWMARFERRRGGATMDAQEAQPDRAAAIGGLGEALVAGYLRELGWPILRNVILRERGGSVEIDLLARAPSSLVVLEVKTWSGLIVGSAPAATWTRHGRDGRAVTVPNTLRQNEMHVAAVVRVIGDRGVPVWGAAVSAGHARFERCLQDHIFPASATTGHLHARSARVRAPASGRVDRAWAVLEREAAASAGRREAHIAWARAREAGRGNCE